MANKKIGIAIHGGAGTILKSKMDANKEKKYLKALQLALDEGHQILAEGGSAIDAVTASVVSLENCPLFNAGRGSVFTSNGKIEMDASLMDGKTLEAGAVAMVRGCQNPILLAKRIMEQSEHVLLAGKGAEKFAAQQGFKKLKEEYFYTEARYKQLRRAKKENKIILDHDDQKFGTVGAVAKDKFGNLAAATSTGGMTNKKFGRIGDSPIIGSGTYADNKSCAISCTGSGEYFIRLNVAFHVSCLMQYANMSLEQACNKVVHELLPGINGDGGLIAIDHLGTIHLPFNTEGMYRAYRLNHQKAHIAIYK